MTAKPFSADIIVTSGWYNAKAYGAAGDGVTNDRAAVQAAIDAANTAGGGIVWFPPGTYIVGRSGGSSFCLDMNAYQNVTLQGIKNKSVIKAAAGLPNASVAVLRNNECVNCTYRDITIDGNWGNAVTTVALASTNVVLPQATINVTDTTGATSGGAFPASGTFSIVTKTGVQVITYTGKTNTSFTGCTGGTGAIIFGDKVGYVNSQNGINQTTQVDPKNYGLMLRGCQDIVIDNCLFVNIYGDGIWMGGSANDVNIFDQNIRIQNTDINIAARSGVALAGNATNVSITNCNLTNILASALDTEPVGGVCRDIVIEHTYLDSWFDPGRASTGALPVTIVGGTTSSPGQMTQARKYRLSDCTIIGAVLIQAALDVTIERCRVICDFAVSSQQAIAPICVTNQCDAIKILDNYIYDRTAGTPGGNHDGSIAVRASAASVLDRNQPTGVLVRGNTIVSRNTNTGIHVAGTGGGAVGGTYTLSVNGTATATSGTTMTDGAATWTVDQWVGWLVRIGTATASIVSNTGTVLTLDIGNAEFATLAWGYPLGEHAATPAAADYVIFKPTGVVEIDSNAIDCSNDGWGQGANGIHVSNQQASTSAAGMRFWCHHNTMRNCTDDGIVVEFQGVTTWQQIILTDNTGHDDQGTPTMTTLLRFSGTPRYLQLVLRGNQPGTSVVTAVAGLTTGTWMISGGLVPMLAGYGSPETVVTAPVGSMYQRLDGGPSTVLYMKETGTGNTGWQPYASPSSGVITNNTQVSPQGLGTTALSQIGPPFTVSAAASSQPGVTDGTFYRSTRKVKYASSGVAGNTASIRDAGGANYIRGSQPGGGYRIVWRFTIGDAVLVGTANMFVGLSGSLAAPTDVAPSTLTDIIGVGVNSGDTNLQLYHAGAAPAARTDLGANFPANTTDTDVYELELICVGGGTTVNYRVTRLNTGDVTSGTISADQPAAGTPLTQVAGRSNGGAASSVAFSFHEFYSEVPV